MKYVNIGIGEFAVSKDPDVELRTYALGSCVAVMIIDKVNNIGGLAHIALPESSIEPERAERLPCRFVDTGLPKLIQSMQDLGADKNPKNFIIKIAGGISRVKTFIDANNIGKRNVLKIRQVLWQMGLGCHAEDVGGDLIRTIYFDVGSLIIRVKSPDGKKWEL